MVGVISWERLFSLVVDEVLLPFLRATSPVTQKQVSEILGKWKLREPTDKLSQSFPHAYRRLP